ncbi:MAG: TonB-dependent receptor [Bacteroidales bacterium]|nr:TonB-dependent receptor [Bacteroidales bacterium]
MKKSFIAIFVVLFSIAINATATLQVREGRTIQGHVLEDGSEENIAFASVLVVETGDGTVSNEEGQFVFSNLAPGNYTLRVSMVGYETMTKEVTVSNDFTSVVHFKLKVEAVAIDEVVVSANRNEINRWEAPVVVSVASDMLFETVNSPDLAKSLNYITGLRVENNCQNCGFPQVRINGLEGPYSQVLINSRPIVSALSGVYGLEQIPVNMIERVEVVRGGGSALFGANAVGGTVNIITKDPVSNSFSVNTNLSCYDGSSWEQNVGANVSLVSRDNSYGIAAYTNYRNRNPYDHDGDGFSELGKININTFGLRTYYRPTHTSRLSLEYHTTNETRRGGNRFDFEPHESDITEQTKHIINSGGVAYDLGWNAYKNKLSLYASVQHIDRNSYYGAQRDPNAYGKTDDLTWVVGGTYTAQMRKCLFSPATFTGGLEYQENRLHDIMTGYKRDMKQSVRIASAFIQNEWDMRIFSLLVGARLDKHNLVDNPIFSPRVNLLFKPNRNFQARLTYSTGFRAPQAYDEDLHVTAVGGEGVQITLAENLKEERSNSFSGSLDWTTSLGHWQANLLLEGFYTDLKNVFILEDVGQNADGFAIKERRNGAGARVYGANIDAKIAHGKDVSLQVGFTLQRSRYKQAEVWTEVDGVEQTTKRMMRTPDYYGYFTLSATPLKRFDLSLSGTYTGSMIVPHYAGYIENDRMETTPDFFDLNFKAAYTFILHDHINLQVNAGVQNIFNSFQSDLDKGEFRDSGYFYGPTQPRTFFVGVKISQ